MRGSRYKADADLLRQARRRAAGRIPVDQHRRHARPDHDRGIDAILDDVTAQVEDILKREKIGGRIHFHVYGKNGVMGALEPVKKTRSHELGIVIEAVAPTHEDADSLCSLTRSTLLHYGYPGRISTAGNLAFPFSPSDIRMGDVYEFSVYHLMQVDDQAMFPLKIVRL